MQNNNRRATENPTRKKSNQGTLKRLFSLSGNRCAFPGCNHAVVNADGIFIAEICHIEAVMPGGERFNPSMTNEERRNFKNLLILCHKHHKITDDTSIYTKEVLYKIKQDHEMKCHELSPRNEYEKINLNELINKYLSNTEPTIPSKIEFPHTTYQTNWERVPFEKTDLVDVQNFIKQFSRLSLEERKFYCYALIKSHEDSDMSNLIFDHDLLEFSSEENYWPSISISRHLSNLSDGKFLTEWTEQDLHEVSIGSNYPASRNLGKSRYYFTSPERSDYVRAFIFLLGRFVKTNNHLAEEIFEDLNFGILEQTNRLVTTIDQES